MGRQITPLGGEPVSMAADFDHGTHHTAHGCKLPSACANPKLCWGRWAYAGQAALAQRMGP